MRPRQACTRAQKTPIRKLSGADHDEAALGEGTTIGRNSGIDGLNKRALLSLVELGDMREFEQALVSLVL